MVDSEKSSATPPAAPAGPAVPTEKQPLLSGGMQVVAVIAMTILTVVCAVIAVRGLGPSAPVLDVSVRVRESGGAVPVFLRREGDERIHELAPGTRVILEEAHRMKGPRYMANVTTPDGVTFQGWVNIGDLVAEDVDRVKRISADDEAARRR
jgi:hypothetical protein